jgi:hypothetical protein
MHRPTKIEIILTLSFLYCSFAAIITVPLLERAYQERGYFAIGGEIIPLISIPFVLLITVICYLSDLGG